MGRGVSLTEYGNERMKKIAVCGKGGSGKSTVVALMAGELCERGRRVLVVDSAETRIVSQLKSRRSAILGTVGHHEKIMEAGLRRQEATDNAWPGIYECNKEGVVCREPVLSDAAHLKLSHGDILITDLIGKREVVRASLRSVAFLEGQATFQRAEQTGNSRGGNRHWKRTPP